MMACTFGLALLATVLLMASAGSQATASITVTGKLMSNGETAWVLKRKTDGVRFRLPGAPTDVNGKPVNPGATVVMSCTLDAARNTTCATTGPAVVVAAAAPMPTTNLNMSVLVVTVGIYGWDDTYYPPMNVSTATRVVLNQTSALMKSCSYNLANINVAASKVITTDVWLDGEDYHDPLSNCHLYKPDFAPRTDDFMYDIEELVEEQLEAYVTIDELANYARLVFVLPSAVDKCLRYWDNWYYSGMRKGVFAETGEHGLFIVPRSVPTIPEGIITRGQVLASFVRSFGVFHSYSNFTSATDSSTCTGNGGEGCPNAPELRRMAWATPVRTLINMFPGVDYNFTLQATARSRNNSFVRIVTNYPSFHWEDYIQRNYYLSFRAPFLGDNTLPTKYRNMLHIHSVDRYVDGTFFYNDDVLSNYEVGVIVPSRTVHNDSMLVITTSQLTTGANPTITFKVCRFASDPNNCKK